jgi:hypothetical protein
VTSPPPTGPAWDKTVSEFLPAATVTRAEADHHYRTIHTAYARRLLRSMDHVLSYHVGLAIGERDLLGTWQQAPRAFRFVTLRFRPGTRFAPPGDVAEAIVQDHRRFVSHHRSFRVDEEVLLDRLRGQTSLLKYQLAFDRRPETTPDEARRQLRAVATGVADLGQQCFGLRQVVLDTVQVELLSEPVDEPGQRPTGRPLPDTLRVGFVEIYADQAEWVEEWFREPEVADLLAARDWGDVLAVRVEEECGLDRR